MRLTTLAPLFALVFALSCPPRAAAQGDAALRIADFGGQTRVVPGQIVELRVEGLGERRIAPAETAELRVQLTQDGSTQTAPVRTASSVFVREREPAPGAAAPADSAAAGMKAYQAISFVLPRGLHAGEAEVVVSYRNRRSAPARLLIMERPPRPIVGGAGIITMSPASMPPPPPRLGRGAKAPAMGLKFERGAKGAALHVRPLTDPEDPQSAVLVRFKQGGTFFDAEARVVRHEKKTQTLPNGGFRMTPARDVLEVNVPELLAPGEAEIEVRLRAAGQEGEAVLVPVTITDAERAYEAPKDAAPRMLAVTPGRVGAGQPVMISVDRRRALDPDPSAVRVVFESPDGAWSFKVKPERNSAALRPDTPPDAPVLLIARAPKQVTGALRVRLLNPAREEYAGASSEPAQIEVVAEALPPEMLGAGAATPDDLARLRQLSAAQTPDGRRPPIYDPATRYVTIRAKGLDYNPRFLRVRMEQEGGASATLGPGDFVLFSNDSVVVRAPKELGAGAVRLSVENRGANGYSPPAVTTFDLPARP